MTFNEFKNKLIPSGVLLLCYFVAPVLAQWFMGASDSIYGRLTFSLLLQAGLGIAVVYKLFGLKQALSEELTARLSRCGQPQAKTQELADRIFPAAGFIIIVAIVGPPAGELIAGGRLMTLLKVAALGYAVYLGFKIWKLAEPFLASVPAEKPPAAQAAPPAAVNRRRCVNCGQPLEEPAEFCAFCKHPAR